MPMQFFALHTTQVFNHFKSFSLAVCLFSLGRFHYEQNDTCEVIILDDDLEAAPGLPMRWDDVVQGGPMPWDKKDCLRSLALPGGFDTGAYKKWVAKLQVRSPFFYFY
jgi:hypothetical protein